MSAKLLILHVPLTVELERGRQLKGYNDLKTKILKIWHILLKVIPVVVGALVPTPNQLKQLLSEIGIEKIVESQKTAILDSAKIL